MGTVSVECLAGILAKPTSKNFLIFSEAYRGMGYNSAFKNALPVTAENAAALMDNVRGYLVNTGYLPYKSLRPWELNSELYSALDQNAPWWGWEFETGYQTKVGCATVVGHVWDTWDHVCFDGEGEGRFISEITFAPVETSKFADRSAPAYQFMQYLSDNRELTLRTNYDAVGTHLNFSTPAIRNDKGPHLMAFVAASINNTIHSLSRDSTNPRKRLFGREHIYGGCFDRGDNEYYVTNNRSGMKWIECKLFRTTYTIEEYDQYVRTAAGIMKCVDALEKMWAEKPLHHNGTHYISNFLDVVDDGMEPIIAEDPAMCGVGESSYVSGGEPYSDDGDDYYSGDEDIGEDENCGDPDCNMCNPSTANATGEY
jgi:hypothetical protein